MKKLISLVLCAIMTLSVFTACGDDKTPSAPNPHNDPEAAPAVTYTAEEITTAMTVGWNLGNTLDAPDGEESWGQPLTTKDMIDKLAELGFKTIRIPTSWGKHTSGAPDYTIDEKWMDRVQEIVDWAMDNDMFVILNSHHDNDFYYPSAENHDEAVNYMTKIWTQVAERFKDYDQHLIFESMNEPRLTGTQYEWNFDSNAKECPEAAKTILDCNQACVDAVRAAGGKNPDRYIMAATYSASPYSAINDAYELPSDPSEKILLSIHAYTPYDLAMSGEYASREFTDNSKKSIDDFVDKIYNKYVKNGIYVVIGECGCTNKGNDDARHEWGKYFISKAKENKMPCVVWDNQHDDLGSECYALFDRYNLEVFPSCKEYYEGIMAGLE